MDKDEQVYYQIVDQFFAEIPELEPLRELAEEEIEISPSLLFFGVFVVATTKNLSRLMKKHRLKAEPLLTKILNFLEVGLQSDGIQFKSFPSRSVPEYIRMKHAREFISTCFVDGLYRAQKEYQALVELAPPELKKAIGRVEKYYGVPKSSAHQLDPLIREELKKILGIPHQ